MRPARKAKPKPMSPSEVAAVLDSVPFGIVRARVLATAQALGAAWSECAEARATVAELVTALEDVTDGPCDVAERARAVLAKAVGR